MDFLSEFVQRWMILNRSIFKSDDKRPEKLREKLYVVQRMMMHLAKALQLRVIDHGTDIVDEIDTSSRL